MSFQALGVAKWLDEALAAMKINNPTAIQSACIPKILKGHDCIGGAKTGSGKTIAFGLPMLSQWSEDPFGIFGLVLTPTRELALQIAEQFAALGSAMNIRVSVIVGGEDFVQQAINLKNKPHFVIATPGRLADHILNSGEETIEGLKRIKYLVLDEADRLLSNSFGSDLERCFSALPSSDARQTLLFTATVTDAVRALKDKPTPKNKPPVFIHEVENIDNIAIPSTLALKYVFVPSYVKEAYLNSILSLPSFKDSTSIIFVNRTYQAEVLRRMLRKLDFRVASLHSEMPQSERTNSLHRFKAGAAKVLIATDVASRGLDIPTVELVINFDIPADPDDFIHRVGRTARAGRKGTSISIIAEKDIDRIKSIEERINTEMTLIEEIDDDKVIKDSLTASSVAKRESLMEMDKQNFGTKRKINRQKKGDKVEKPSHNKKK
ncbi:ATP-dependent RNA helicase DBP8 [Scheffersomyces coipomensis]|uniref:ATP-dependent RNA helicase DBP8 n=1 Tax=Scheffersomyces coipomensis TaxID=1788519 RepID=UPI00315CCB83